MDNEDFRKQVQAFDKTIDCDITVIFWGVWHKIYPFSKDYALEKYIDTFKKSEEYIWQHSNSRRERIASILTMKAVSAMHKAMAEMRSQNEFSIISSAIDDTIESFENENQNKNVNITNSTSKRRKRKAYKASHKK